MVDPKKYIIKNTLLLYIRTLFVLIVSLYTSRVILNTLGVEDYGIYNIVGGVVSTFSFMSGALGGASSRYITYELGVGDNIKLKKVFGTILLIHFLLAIAVFLIGETLGVWFVINKLQIPEHKINTALFVYHLSLVTMVISIISIPYNALIIAYERMKVFAYISALDALLKLILVYLLFILPYDKLRTYAILLCSIQILDRIIYGAYCKKQFPESNIFFVFDKKILREIISYTAWIINGAIAVVSYTQGLNILLNIFFGPVANTARSIAVQVQGVVGNFSANFQMALNPQLTKSYARKDIESMHRLLILSSKFSFFLLVIISLPLLIDTSFVLKLWLGIIPEYTITFLRIVLLANLLSALSNPILIAIHATGKIRQFQMIEGSLLLLILPTSYVLLKYFKQPPESVFVVYFFIELITQCVRVAIVLPKINMLISDYLHKVIYPLCKVCIMLLIIIIPYYKIGHNQNVTYFLITCCYTGSISLLTIYLMGCTKEEKRFINKKIISVTKKSS